MSSVQKVTAKGIPVEKIKALIQIYIFTYAIDYKRHTLFTL